MRPLTARVTGEDLVVETRSSTEEDHFRVFYEGTAWLLRAYLIRMLNDVTKADDILQESYLRLLQAKLPVFMDSDHRKNYLFRIATNLVRGEMKRSRTEPLTDCLQTEVHSTDPSIKPDFTHLLRELKPRQRELLWLAYVERFNHNEIAGIIGAAPASIRPMLARARQKLAEILRRGGFGDREMRVEKR